MALLTLGAVLVIAGSAAGTATKTTPKRPPQTVVIKVEGGLRWLDVGIGAATALAAVSIVAGVVLGTGRRDPDHDEQGHQFGHPSSRTKERS
jgi:hypothetical protein